MLIIPVTYQVDILSREEKLLESNGFCIFKDSKYCTFYKSKKREDKEILLRHLWNYKQACELKYGKFKEKRVQMYICRSSIDKGIFTQGSEYTLLEEPVFIGNAEFKDRIYDLWLVYKVLKYQMIKKVAGSLRKLR